MDEIHNDKIIYFRYFAEEMLISILLMIIQVYSAFYTVWYTSTVFKCY